MAELAPVIVTVNHSSVLDEIDGGQSAKKKTDTGSKSPGNTSHITTYTYNSLSAVFVMVIF